MMLNIFWFRRDLRLEDNAGLYHALKAGDPVLPIFIFDTSILGLLEDRKDRRVAFIHEALKALQSQLLSMGSSLLVLHGDPLEIFRQLLGTYHVGKVYANHDYEVYARERDKKTSYFLAERSVPFITYKDQVIFEKAEIMKDDGAPYTVFTPYSKKWKTKLNEFYISSYPAKTYFHNFYKHTMPGIPSLESMGFIPVHEPFPSRIPGDAVITHYSNTRDFPALEGTSRMGVHLRFGTVSIRQLLQKALPLNAAYVNELTWRDFYHMITWHFPHTGHGKAFKPEYDNIEWRRDTGEFEKWCSGTTGYPIVDAGMRELNATGYMHNRVRMIVASFLSKHLLLDWRLGEAWFAAKLLDFDFAANNGGWQWAAGSGCDAAPYFRIFNPVLQTQKFDKNLEYIRKWIPELDSVDYPKPVVDHAFARERCLKVYARALKKVES